MLIRSQTRKMREETNWVLETIKAGQKQVEHRVRQHRLLLLGREVETDGTCSFCCPSGPLTAQRLDLPNPNDAREAAGRGTRQAGRIRLLIQQISNGHFLNLGGNWTKNRMEAREFSTVRQVLLFALEHLTIPVGVYCAFPDGQYDFSIVLRGDFSTARRWDSCVREIELAANRESARVLLIVDDGTDQIQALQYLRPPS